MRSSTDFLKTRIPLAESVIRCALTRLTRPAKMKLPSRRTGGISLAAPAMRDPIAISAFCTSAARHRSGKSSGG